MMNWKNTKFLSGIIFAGVIQAAIIVNFSSSSVEQADKRNRDSIFFPYQFGFPRDDINGTVDFASPSVVDIDNDGKLEILTAGSHGCIWAWNTDGSLHSGFPLNTLGNCSKNGRIHGPLAIGDVDGDGILEIVAGTRGTSNTLGERGKVFIWNNDGTLMPGWPKEMEWNTLYATSQSEVRSVALGNLVGDGRLEVIAGTTNNGSDTAANDVDSRNLYAYSFDGKVLPGYPTWYRSAGIFGFVGVANLICDDYSEVIVGRDHVYLHAYRPDGRKLNENWPVHTFVDVNHDIWGVDPYIEFTHNAPAMADLDSDGEVEIVIAGKVRDPKSAHNTIGSGILVVEPNGQRRAGWEVAKLSDQILAENGFYPSQAPALADLDLDGELEIVVTLRDGTVRVHRENGDLFWKYDFAQGNILYGSEPVIADITGDNNLDIVFGTYSPDGSADAFARVIGLDSEGNQLPGFPLSLTEEGNSGKQGVRAAPTITDIDGDGDVEIIVASWAGILYVWDLPGTYHAGLMPWPTGRHDNFRTGSNENLSNFTQQSRPWVNDSMIFNQILYFPLTFNDC